MTSQIDWNKIKADTENKQKKFGRFSLADVACFALIEVIDGMFSANARAAQLEAERDAFAAENDAIHRAVNEMCGTDTSTIEAVQHVINERDEARRQLEQARQVCAYWLHDARFIVANTKEHNEAVEMLKVVVGDSH